MASSSNSNNIKVVCRFRPQNTREINEGGKIIIDLDDNKESCKIDTAENGKLAFTYDKIFGWDSKQNEIFDDVVKPIVDDVLDGYNGTVFAYGQTGSGKTFTMMGADIDDTELRGIIPRIVEQVFESIKNCPATYEFTVKVSYMEIYMERIKDLLNPQNDNLPIHEEKTRGVYVKGLLEVYVSSVEEVYEVMRRGSQARVVAFTNMNAESSRSHSIFVITLTQRNTESGSVKSGKLYLVDLAGSEKVGKTGASGQTLEEAKKINTSLTSLGMVINALTDGKSKHIPYRDSKLTRILQESLGGNSRTTLIINASPSSFNEAETTGTLRFGMRAKNIKNKAQVNQELSAEELKKLLKKTKAQAITFQAYINALEVEVKVWRKGGKVNEAEFITFERFTGGNVPQIVPAAPMTPSKSQETISLAEEEKEEFLNRENELVDQLSQKESELALQKEQIEAITEELALFKSNECQMLGDNKTLNRDLNELKVELQKITNEKTESEILLESFKERNDELTREMEELQKTLEEISAKQNGFDTADIENKKKEKLAEMMASFSPSGDISEKESKIRETLGKLEVLSGDVSLTPEEIQTLQYQLLLLKSDLDKKEQTVCSLQKQVDMLEKENDLFQSQKQQLENRFNLLETEYEDLLDKTIEEEQKGESSSISENIKEWKKTMEEQHTAKEIEFKDKLMNLQDELKIREKDFENVRNELVSTKLENDQLKMSLGKANKNLSALVAANDADKDKDLEKLKTTMAQQLSDFDVMKKALMRDIQSRCEKVVELEMSLEEARKQYNGVLRNSNNKSQQKKMAFLERNLEQLTSVQKQLVDQNSSLKKEVAIFERKLQARNERIENLEQLLQGAQDQLTTQNQRFEQQLTLMREKLQEAKAQKQVIGANEWMHNRVAKPVRGGKGIEGETAEKGLASPPISSWLPGFMGGRK